MLKAQSDGDGQWWGGASVEADRLLRVYGTDGDDWLRGTAADERFLPYLGRDDVDGGGGDDTLKVDYSDQGSVGRFESYITGQSNGEFVGAMVGGDGPPFTNSVSFQHIDHVVLYECTGDDYVGFTPTGSAAGSVRVDGGSGNDQLHLFCDAIYAGLTLIHHSGALDFMGGHFTHFESFGIRLGNGNDHVEFGGGDDFLLGGAGDDVLNGGGDDDDLLGGTGGDVLTGGRGADQFVFATLSDFLGGQRQDEIMDFRHKDGDTIDLSQIDADPTVAGDQAFTLLGGNPFTGIGTAYELRFDNDGHGTLTVQIDTNHDKLPDIQFIVHASDLVPGDIVA